MKGRMMPEYRKGDMFDAPGVHIVAASSSLSQDVTLIMGLGAAYAMKRRYQRAPKLFGEMIHDYCGHQGSYGLLLYGGMGILQTRVHYNDKIDLNLVKYGLKILRTIAEGNPTLLYNLTHPGLGYDRSKLPGIEKVLEGLPNNVIIWERE